jgi:hypothetical protein
LKNFLLPYVSLLLIYILFHYSSQLYILFFLTEYPQGLSNYLQSFAYSSTTEDDLFFYLEEAGLSAGTWPGSYPLEEAVHQSFGEVMKSWTNQVTPLHAEQSRGGN